MRSFVLLILTVAASFAQMRASITAQEVIDRIVAHTGATPAKDTVDTFKAGDPHHPVTGIAVTMMATYDVLERAAAAGANLIITHEPTFYNHQDNTAELAAQNDAVLAAKQKFIASHGLIIWRFHDGWHRRNPDGILAGMTKALGWEAYADKAEPHLFRMPATTLGELARDAQRKLSIETPRMVGDADAKITRVALMPGAAGSDRQIRTLERDDVELLVIGETREWETVEYTADAVSEGRHKALLILGHIPSEQAGMEECATWLRTFVSEVPVRFVPAREPFRKP